MSWRAPRAEQSRCRRWCSGAGCRSDHSDHRRAAGDATSICGLFDQILHDDWGQHLLADVMRILRG
jgi:hypothetical protein